MSWQTLLRNKLPGKTSCLQTLFSDKPLNVAPLSLALLYHDFSREKIPRPEKNWTKSIRNFGWSLSFARQQVGVFL